jgi:hypothetical protein
MPIYIPASSAALAGSIQWFIVSTDGVVHDLTWQVDRQIFVPKGTKGLGSADVELILEKLPFSPGSKLRYIRTSPKEINLPLVVSKPTLIEAMIAAENVRSWFYTGDERNSSPAFLRIKRPQDDVTRQIAVYYNGGLGGDLEEGSPTFIPYVIQLVAPDPTWTDMEPTELLYDDTDVGNVLVITNPGDYDAYPVWTIGGPITNVKINNLTTNKFIEFTTGSLVVPLGEFIIIDTRPPTERTLLPVTDQDGISLYNLLTSSSSLETWFSPGANQIQITASGTSASTTIALSYLPRYRGVLR